MRSTSSCPASHLPDVDLLVVAADVLWVRGAQLDVILCRWVVQDQHFRGNVIQGANLAVIRRERVSGCPGLWQMIRAHEQRQLHILRWPLRRCGSMQNGEIDKAD